MTAVSDSRNNSTSLRRALSVLRTLEGPTADGSGCALGELAGRLTMNKSTLLRLLQPLREEGLVAMDADGRYRIGLGAVSLGDSYLAGLDLRSTARPVLEKLSAETSETVHLLVYRDAGVVYVDKVDGASAVRMVSRVGDRMPAHCTAAGKAFLAFLPRAEVDATIASGMVARTSQTITTAAELETELRRVRHVGYAVDNVENEVEIRCVGAPVFDHECAVTAAISISGPQTRIRKARVAELGARLRVSTNELSVLLGAPSDFVPELTE